MIRRLVSATLLSVSLVAPLASHASLLGHTPEPTTAATGKQKSIRLTLKNKGAAPLTVYFDGKPVTLAANGGTQEIRATVGSDILDADGTTVRLHVTNDLGGNTVSFR